MHMQSLKGLLGVGGARCGTVLIYYHSFRLDGLVNPTIEFRMTCQDCHRVCSRWKHTNCCCSNVLCVRARVSTCVRACARACMCVRGFVCVCVFVVLLDVETFTWFTCNDQNSATNFPSFWKQFVKFRRGVQTWRRVKCPKWKAMQVMRL
jgi:hypothetical protein